MIRRFFIHILIQALICASVPAWAATTYYVSDCQSGAHGSCVAGNDANTSTQAQNPATPWRTLAAITSVLGGWSTLAAGDQILHADGGAWTYSATFDLDNAANSSAAKWSDVNPIKIGHYSPSWGGTAKPWIKISSAPLFQTDSSSTKGYWFDSLLVDGVTAPTTSSGVISLAGLGFTKFTNVDMKNMSAAIYYAANSPCTNGLRWIGGSIQETEAGGTLIAADNVQFDGVLFKNNNNSGAIGGHDYYAQAPVTPVTAKPALGGCHNLEIVNSTFEYANPAKPCRSVMFVAHNVLTSITVDNNTFIQSSGTAGGSCYGIQVAAGNHDHPENYEGYPVLKIRNNTFTDLGYVSIDVAQAQDVDISNNTIVHTVAGEWVGIRVGNVIANPNSADDLVGTRIAIRNNTVKFAAGGSSDSHGIEISRDGTGHVVVGNLVDIGSTSQLTYCFYSESLSTGAFTEWNYNLCYGHGGSGFRWATFNGTNYTSLANFTSGTGFDANGISGDPLLTGTTPDVGSPAIDACASSRCAPLGRGGKAVSGVRNVGSAE